MGHGRSGHRKDQNSNYEKSGLNIFHICGGYSTSLKSMVGNGGLIRHIVVNNHVEEAKWIIWDIEQAMCGVDLIQSSKAANKNSNTRFSDIAVIYRTHHVGKMIAR